MLRRRYFHFMPPAITPLLSLSFSPFSDRAYSQLITGWLRHFHATPMTPPYFSHDTDAITPRFRY